MGFARAQPILRAMLNPSYGLGAKKVVISVIVDHEYKSHCYLGCADCRDACGAWARYQSVGHITPVRLTLK